MLLRLRSRSRTAISSDDGKLLAALCVMCGSIFAAGVLAPNLLGHGGPDPRIMLGDLSETHIVEVRDGSGATLLSGELRSRVDGLGNTERDAELRDTRSRRVIGEIEIEIPAPSRSNRRPELEVDIMGLPARQRFAIAIDDRGSVDFELQEGEHPR